MMKKKHNKTNLRQYISSKESLSSTIGIELACAAKVKGQNNVSIVTLKINGKISFIF